MESNGVNSPESPADPDDSSILSPAEILLKMHPRDILFSQDTIAPFFRFGKEKKTQSKGDAKTR